MATSHRTNRLKLVSSPSVEKLQNGRFRLIFRARPLNPRESWYNTNKSRIFADFGTLQNAEMSIDGIGSRTGATYDNMRLVDARTVEEGESYLVQFTYETIGSTFIQVKDDTVSFTESGLRKVQRESIAAAGTSFAQTIGGSASGDSISHQINSETAVTCRLAAYEINDTDSSRTVIATYVEEGTLSQTEDLVGSQKAIVIESIGQDPSTPSGYSPAKKEQSNFEGLQTNRFTFLKNNAVLLRNTEQKQSGSSTDGKIKIQTVEVFNGTPASSIGGVKISEQESNIGGIETTKAVFALGSGEVSRTVETRNKGALTITTVEALGSKGASAGVVIESSSRQEDGYTLFRTVYASGSGKISSTTEKRNQGKLTITTVESIGSKITASGAEIESSEREENGYTVFKSVAASGNGRISETSTTADSRLGNCREHTIVSIGSAIIPPGAPIRSSDETRDGFTVFTRTSISGQIAGVKTTYKDTAEVDVPGKVILGTQNVSSANESGTIATIQVQPKRKKKIPTNVEISVGTNPSNTNANPAYNLGEISCSVFSTNIQCSVGAGSTVTVGAGTNNTRSDTGFIKDFKVQSNITTFPGHYLAGPTQRDGLIDYISSSQPIASGTSITRKEERTQRKTQLIGRGSTKPDGWNTSGTISKRARPILTDLNGNVYFEIITVSA